MTNDERAATRDLLRRLGTTSIGAHMILAGSSGLYTASDSLPALTEDLDFLIDAEWLAAHEHDVLTNLFLLGFQHQAGTATFVDSDGVSLDLVGYSRAGDTTDRIGGGVTLRVMVYGDLGPIMATATAVVALPGGGRALSPAALVASKLLTIRLEKGSKDKLQALLLIEEHGGDSRFHDALRALLRPLGADRLADLVADAQAAVLVLSADPLRADAQSIGYAPWHAAAERGLRLLVELAGSGAP